jgi:hypothetical protein
MQISVVTILREQTSGKRTEPNGLVTKPEATSCLEVKNESGLYNCIIHPQQLEKG